MAPVWTASASQIPLMMPRTTDRTCMLSSGHLMTQRARHSASIMPKESARLANCANNVTILTTTPPRAPSHAEPSDASAALSHGGSRIAVVPIELMHIIIIITTIKNLEQHAPSQRSVQGAWTSENYA
mmetsp:Transcript_133771/g.243975  ORF Transcript_133771/g.243975 Transcript_133771/m.243975 type:complete len:128 (+) Transcript_133771:3110-3493(+)